MNREQIGKFLILRELQHKENVGKLNEKGKDVLLMLQFDEDNLNNKDMKEVLEFIDNLEANQNQKAIECLRELNEKLTDIIIAETEDIWDFKFGQSLERISASFGELLNNKIKELEGNNDTTR